MKVKRIEEKGVKVLKVGDVISFEMLDGEKVEAMAVEQNGENMTFCLVDCLEQEYRMNPTNTNKGGWEESELRQKMNEEILARFPQDIKDLLVPFENGDLLRVPSLVEMFGENEFEECETEEKQWEPMKNRRNRVCNRGQQEEYEYWWLRDVVSAAYFACVNNYSFADGSYASNACGVRPAFKIKNL